MQFPNVTRTTPNLRQQEGLKSAPGAKAKGLVKFLQWFDEHGADINIQKMSPTTLTAFGLGWYVSDSLTREEKQKWQRQLDDEFNRSVERQGEVKRTKEAKRLSRSGGINKSAFDELQEYYQERIKYPPVVGINKGPLTSKT